MNKWAALLLSTLLAACATAPAPQPNDPLFRDSLFAAPSERIDARDVFALSPEMKDYLAVQIAPQLRIHGRQRGLIDALYNKTQLKLEFDSAMTRTAAQAFAARSGNCLSLVIMTAAFAKELGLSVRYQKVYVDETWSRSGDNLPVHRARQPDALRADARGRLRPRRRRPDDRSTSCRRRMCAACVSA